MAADAADMIRVGSTFAQLQQQLLDAASKLAEVRAAERATSDNTANWRSARWLWPLL